MTVVLLWKRKDMPRVTVTIFFFLNEIAMTTNILSFDEYKSLDVPYNRIVNSKFVIKWDSCSFFTWYYSFIERANETTRKNIHLIKFCLELWLIWFLPVKTIHLNFNLVNRDFSKKINCILLGIVFKWLLSVTSSLTRRIHF